MRNPHYNDKIQPMQTKICSNLAIAALAFSCASVIIGPLGCIPGIILGKKALREIHMNEHLNGRGIAKSAIIIGWIFTALSIISFIMIFLIIFTSTGEIKPFIYTLD